MAIGSFLVICRGDLIFDLDAPLGRIFGDCVVSGCSNATLQEKERCVTGSLRWGTNGFAGFGQIEFSLAIFPRGVMEQEKALQD